MHFRILFRQSKMYLAILSLLHFIALIVFTIYYVGWLKLFLMALMLMSYGYALYFYYFYWIEILEVRADGKVFLQKKGQSLTKVKIKKVLFHNSYWMIVHWQQGKRKIIQIISRDSCGPKEYQQLFLWLNWMISWPRDNER